MALTILAQSTILKAAAKRARQRWLGRTVAVLLGGLTPERPISFKTGRGVARALRERGYSVVEVDARRDLPRRLQEADVDVAFVSLHGYFGEDGCVQGLLEYIGVPYTHSSVLASAAAMDKSHSKRLLRAAGLPTPSSVEFRVGEEAASAAQLGLRFPVVVKPVVGGSSQHMAQAATEADLAAALDTASQSGFDLLIEEFIEGEEYTVTVIEGDDGRGRALPVVGIRPVEGWFDYKNKYQKGSTEYDVPAPLDPETTAQIQDLAERCFDLHACSGVARIDLMLHPQDGPQILEINAIPGMTETSLVPMAARAVDVDYGTLCEAILGMARLHLVAFESTPDAAEVEA